MHRYNVCKAEAFSISYMHIIGSVSTSSLLGHACVCNTRALFLSVGSVCKIIAHVNDTIIIGNYVGCVCNTNLGQFFFYNMNAQAVSV